MTTALDSSGMKQVFVGAQNVTSVVKGGSLAGAISVRDSEIPSYLNQLNTLASGIATSFNNAQRSGYDMAGAIGGVFFTPPNGIDDAANFAVALSNSDGIAASSDGSTGSSGNLPNLISIGQQSLPSGQNPIDSYANLVSAVGNASAQSQAEATASNSALQQLSDQRSSVSGVSLDEETANLIRYQQSFQAAARVVSTVDQLTQTLLNMGAN